MKDHAVPQQAFTLQTAKDKQKTKVFFGFFKCDRLCNDYFLHKSTHYTVFQCCCLIFHLHSCPFHSPLSFPLTFTKKDRKKIRM